MLPDHKGSEVLDGRKRARDTPLDATGGEVFSAPILAEVGLG